MNLGGFSWRRALGLSAAKARLSRRIIAHVLLVLADALDFDADSFF
jgi:hypothetical protein